VPILQLLVLHHTETGNRFCNFKRAHHYLVHLHFALQWPRWADTSLNTCRTYSSHSCPPHPTLLHCWLPLPHPPFPSTHNLKTKLPLQRKNSSSGCFLSHIRDACLSLSLSACISLSLSFSMHISLSFFQHLSFSLSLSLSFSIYLSLSLSLFLSALSFSLSLSPFYFFGNHA